MTLWATVETGNMTQVFASRIDNIGSIDIWWLGRNQSCFNPACVLNDVVAFFSPSELFGQRSRYSRNTRNISVKSVGVCIELFRSAHIDNPKLTRLGFGIFFEGLFQGSQVEEAEDLATAMWARQLLCEQCWSIFLKMEGS